MPREWTSRHKCSAKCVLNYLNAFLICAGFLIMIQVFKFYSFLPTAYISFMFSMAAIIAACGILGIVGTLSENLCLIKSYAIITLVAIILQVIGICLAHKFTGLIGESVRNKVKKQWRKELEYPGAMDNLQTEFQCCGNDSSRDYINILHRAEIPSSCYTANVTDITLNTKGCFIGAEEAIYISYAVSSRVAWFGVVLNILMFAVVVYFVIKLNNKKRRDNYQP